MSVPWRRGRTRRTSKLIGVIAAVFAMVVASATAALAAGSLSSDLDASLNGVQKDITLATALPGGTNQSQDVRLAVNGGGSTSSTWSITGASPSGSTVSGSMSAVSVSSDGTPVNGKINWTTPAAGTTDVQYTLSINFTASGGGSALSTNGAAVSISFTVAGTGSPSNTKPTVAVTGFTNGDSFELGYDTLPTAMCEVTDDHDTVAPFAATMSDTLVHGLGTVTATCDYTDEGGLAADAATASYTIVDTTDPTISGSTDRAPNDNGWYNDDVTVAFTCDDTPGSGIQSCLADGESDSDVALSSEGANQSAGGTATDWAGNTGTDSVSGINIDKTAPSVSLVGGPQDGATYYFGFVPTAPTCNASDTLSGLDGACAVSGYDSALGEHTVSASVNDKAGNPGAATATYTVLGWTTNGFFKPVDMGDVVNTVKAGSTVPLKFELFAGSMELTDTAYVKGFSVTQVPCSAGQAVDAVEFTTTGGTSLRYDATAGQFVQNWKTPSGAGKCYVATMTAQDGSTISANFKTK